MKPYVYEKWKYVVCNTVYLFFLNIDILYMLKFIMKPMNGVNIAISRHNKKKNSAKGRGGAQYLLLLISFFRRKDYMKSLKFAF